MTLSPATALRPALGARTTILDIMAAAFQDDPVSAWFFPDDAPRPIRHHRFFGVFVDLVLAHGDAHLTDDRTGTALWIDVAPTDHDDPDFLRQLQEAADDHDRVAAFDAATRAAHPTHRAHAYLMFLAVDPAHQGTGVGATMLSRRLTELDRTGTPAYLESSTPRNRRLYERFGFRAIQQIDLPGGPPLTGMWREPSVTGQRSGGRVA